MINVLLSEKLASQERARIILVNSEGHRFAAWGLRMDDLNWEKRRYSGLKSYGSAAAKKMTFVLMADKAALHGQVVQLMDVAKTAGFGQLAIATDKSETPLATPSGQEAH